MAWHATWNDSPKRRSGWLTDRGGFFPPGVKLILYATVAVFLLDKILWAPLGLPQIQEGHSLMRPLEYYGALTVSGLLHLELWRLVTYMFLHATIDHILINMFMFVMLGVAFERQIGTRPFLALYFVAGVVGALLEVAFNGLMFARYGAMPLDAVGHTLLTMPTVGASAGVAGLLVGFATLNPRATFLLFFFLPIDALWVALGYVVYETWPIFKDLFISPAGVWTDHVAHAAHFGGMIVGFVWMKWGHRLELWWHSRPAPAAGTYLAADPDAEEAELDRILDKIQAKGIDSLTTGEKMFLQEISRRRRGS